MTPIEIFEYKQKWLPGHVVEVHSDLLEDCVQWCKSYCKKWEWSVVKYSGVYQHQFRFEHKNDSILFRSVIDERTEFK